jgi:putative peptide zinc metalloprotease protein
MITPPEHLLPLPLPGLVIHGFDTRVSSGFLLVESPDGRRWHVSPHLADLLDALRSASSLGEAAATLSARWNRVVTAAALERQIDRTLYPMGLVIYPSRPAARSAREFGGGLAFLTLRARIAPARLVSALAAPVTPLFRPPVFWLAAIVLIAVYPWLLLSKQLLQGGEFWDGFLITPGVVALLVASQLVHEIGHAAAARALGARHGALGFGLYLIYPVFYMELDDVWRLPHRARALVDVAGIFLQLLFGGGVLCLGLAWAPFRHTAFSLATLLVTLTVYNLNPALRTDGYWLVSDLLGVPNLRRRAAAALKSIVRGRRVRLPGVSAGVATALAAYSVLSTSFLAYALWRFSRRFVMGLDAYGDFAQRELRVIARLIAAHEPLSVLSAVMHLLGPTALMAGGAMMLAMGAVQAWRAIVARIPLAPARTPDGVRR